MKRISNDDVEILVLDGRIDQQASEDLETVLQECLEKETPNICIDLINVKHICSSALGVLVAAKRRIKDQEGDIKLIVASENLLKLFETTMLDKVFEIYESQRECLPTFD